MEARFVSKGGNYSLGVRDAEVEHYATGREKVLIPHLEVKFAPRDVQEDDLRTALDKMKRRFTGLPFDRETEEHVSIRSRIGVWDSRTARRERMKPEDVDACINALRTSDRLGLDFVEVEAAILKAPWPGYDKMDGRHPEKIVETAITIEADINDVIAYERENKARKQVLEALNEALDTDPAEAEVVIHA